MIRYGRIAALVGAALLAACGDKVERTVTGPAPAARVKFFNFAVVAPGTDFWGNGAKLTAISSSAGVPSPLGTPYGSAAGGGFYVSVAPGQYTFNGKMADTTAANRGLVISTTTQSIENGKAYSVYQSGIYDSTTKHADSFIVEDTWTDSQDFSVTRIRFVNAVSNGTSPIALYVKNQATGSTEVAIGTATAYKGATAYVTLPPGIYDLYARYQGSATNLVTRTSVSLGGLRVNTVTIRGDATSTSTTRRPTLDVTANY